MVGSTGSDVTEHRSDRVNQPFEATVHLVFGAVLAALLVLLPARGVARR